MKQAASLNINDKKKLNKDINVIYSGNAQKCQKIDHMIDVIKFNLSENINYTILSGEEDKFKNKYV